MKKFALAVILAVSTIFTFSCKTTPACESNNTGSILFHNPTNGFNYDSAHIFLGSADLGMIRLDGELQADNLPVGKNLYLFKYHNFEYAEDSITVTQCATAHYTITYLPISDKRLKKNIVPLSNALANIDKLNIYSFEYNAPKGYTNYLPSGTHFGFMAQELKEVYPSFVQMNKNGYYSVNYQEMIPILAQGIKEQQREIDALKKEVAELNSLVKNQQPVAMK